MAPLTLLARKPELLWPAQAELGEGPVWIEREDALYWVNIKGNAIHRLQWSTSAKKSWKTKNKIGTLLPVLKGGFIGAFDNGIHLVTLDEASENASTQLIIDPEVKYPNNRFNDGKIGPDGAFWTGSMDDIETNATGSLYRISEQGNCTVKDSGYIVTNGPTFSLDGKTLYHTDTFAGEIYAFDMDASGEISNKRLFITIPKEDGYPDGMCVDNDGCLWVCHWGGWRLTRFSPQGQEIGRIAMPVSNVTSCVFGGDDFKTLFITTAKAGLSEEELSKQPSAGGLFAVSLDVAGPQTQYFDYKG